MTSAYDPAKKFEIRIWDTEFRRDPARTLKARIYQPQGDGPFPALLDPTNRVSRPTARWRSYAVEVVKDFIAGRLMEIPQEARTHR